MCFSVGTCYARTASYPTHVLGDTGAGLTQEEAN
jgi:hypothetical protein